MRRIILIVVLVAVVGFAGYMLLKPKGSGGAAKGKSASRRAGQTTGKVQPKSKKELREDRKKRRKEERLRKREMRRREREKKKQLRLARRMTGSRRSRRGRKGSQAYVVKAIVSLGSESYALVDSRRVMVGDVVMGRRVVGIQPDRIEIEAFGKRSTIRVGESLLPSYTSSSRRRRRG